MCGPHINTLAINGWYSWTTRWTCAGSICLAVLHCYLYSFLTTIVYTDGSKTVNHQILLSPVHTADADASVELSRVASAVWTQFATSLRRLPTDSVDNLETEHSSLTMWIWSILITFSTVILFRHLSPTSIVQKHRIIVNWVMTADGCIHDADTTQPDFAVGKFVQICSDSSRLSPTSCKLCTHRRRNSTRQLSRVGGVYWA